MLHAAEYSLPLSPCRFPILSLGGMPPAMISCPTCFGVEDFMHPGCWLFAPLPFFCPPSNLVRGWPFPPSRIANGIVVLSLPGPTPHRQSCSKNDFLSFTFPAFMKVPCSTLFSFCYVIRGLPSRPPRLLVVIFSSSHLNMVGDACWALSALGFLFESYFVRPVAHYSFFSFPLHIPSRLTPGLFAIFFNGFPACRGGDPYPTGNSQRCFFSSSSSFLPSHAVSLFPLFPTIVNLLKHLGPL